MDSDTIWGLPVSTELVCFWRNIINYNNDLKTVLAPWNAEKKILHLISHEVKQSGSLLYLYSTPRRTNLRAILWPHGSDWDRPMWSSLCLSLWIVFKNIAGLWPVWSNQHLQSAATATTNHCRHIQVRGVSHAPRSVTSFQDPYPPSPLGQK